MCGLTKFPFIDESAWIYSHQDNNLINASITTNNSRIDKYLQQLTLIINSELNTLIELNGRIYTKLSMFEKDCEYYYYRAKYKRINGIFLPDTTYYYYYSKKDTSLSKPQIVINTNYKFKSLKSDSLKKQCWIKKIDCNEYNISNDEILLNKFFKEKVFVEKICFITGEVLTSQRNYDHIGATLDPTISVYFKLIQDYKNSRVWKVSLLDTSNQGTDYYVELVDESNNIKISRIRAFTLPGFYYAMVDSLERKKELTSEEKQRIF